MDVLLSQPEPRLAEQMDKQEQGREGIMNGFLLSAETQTTGKKQKRKGKLGIRNPCNPRAHACIFSPKFFPTSLSFTYSEMSNTECCALSARRREDV